MLNFLQPQTVAALGATNRMYTKDFILQPSSDGTTPTSQGSDKIQIQAGYHFFTERVFISYPTVTLDGNDPPNLIDTGFCYVTLQLQTNSVSPIFSDPALLSLIAVPGRSIFPGAVNVDLTTNVPFASAPYISGFPFNLFLAASTAFQHNFTNLSRAPGVNINVAWQGWEFLTSNCEGPEAFNRILRQNQSAPFVS